jgi:hypothetical protein
MKEVLTAELIRELLSYDPDTGLLTWRVRPSMGVRQGAAAGSLRKDGYLAIRIRMQTMLAHRLAWMWMTGEWPPAGFEIDHSNADRADNRWCNLRLATRSQNRMNSAGVLGRQLPKGVTRSKRGKPFSAAISVNGRMKRVGAFDTIEAASNAYEAAARAAFGEFARAV